MWYIALSVLIIVYLLINTVFPQYGNLGIFVFGPILWILLALICLFLAKQEGFSILKFKKVRRWYLGNSPQQAGLLIGGFHIAMLIIVGLFAGFGSSPYLFTLPGLLQNIFFVSCMIIGMEICRAYLVKQGSKKNITLSIGLTTLVFVFIQIPPFKLLNIFNFNQITFLEFIGATIITSISINLLACYLSYMGGATASMGYIGMLFAFEWFSPFLPNPHWTILALVGTIAPAIGFLLIQYSVIEPGERKKRIKIRKTKQGSWTAIAIFSVILIFFSFGYFGVKPVVIYSGSMQPVLNVGDIVIIEKVKAAEIKLGDIIQVLTKDDITIVHRVVEKFIDENGQIVFITKGDANDISDPNPVYEKHVLGKAIFTIPKIGWIQINMNELFKSLLNPTT